MVSQKEFYVQTQKLSRDLQKLGELTSPKIAKKATNAALALLANRTRKAITASSAPIAVKRAARKAVGHRILRFDKFAGGQAGKFGFSVGKRKPSARDKKRPGVGISKQNVHWAVAGTTERKHDESGKSTGRMPAYFLGLIRGVLSSNSSAAFHAAEQKLSQELEKRIVKR